MTWISGGVMFGNCATGKLRTVSEPTNTMTMEITMATMERLMKNFDIDHLSLVRIHRSLIHRSLIHRSLIHRSLVRRSLIHRSLVHRFFVSCYERLGIHVHTGAHPLNSLNYDSVACIESARDDPSVLDAVAHHNRSNINFIVCTNDGNLVAALQFRYRALGNKQRSRLFADHSSYLAVASGPQNVVRVGEESGDSNRAGGLVHLPIRKIKPSLMWIHGPVRQNQLQPQFLVGL